MLGLIEKRTAFYNLKIFNVIEKYGSISCFQYVITYSTYNLTTKPKWPNSKIHSTKTLKVNMGNMIGFFI